MGRPLLLLLCVLLFVNTLRADEFFTPLDESPSPALAQVMDRAVIVARVRLTDRNAMDLFGPVKKGSPVRPDWVCGYTYHAKVLESLKGPDTDFDFFSAVEADFKGFDRDYLVFVYHHDRENVQKAYDAVRPLLRVSEATKLHCKLVADYYVPVQPQLLRAFDPEATKQFGGAWLTLPNRDSMTWCVGTASPQRYITRKKNADDRVDNLIQWQSAKSYILEARKSWYRFWDDRLAGC
jgi:hypothetical protein